MQITEFPLEAGSKPLYITPGPEGNLWFTDGGTNKIGRITTSGQVTEYGLGLTPDAGLSGITTGPEGNLWFTEREGHKLGRITPQGTITEISAGLTGNPDIYGIAAVPGGDLWFTETSQSKIGSIDPLTGQITEFPAPSGVYTKIIVGPEGDLWYMMPVPGEIARITQLGSVQVFGPLPAAACAPGAAAPCPYPDSIAVGSDGNLWFNEASGDGIGRITPTGNITEYTAGLSHGAAVKDLALGPEGNVWFGEEAADQVGKISPAGAITEFGSGISSAAAPFGITLGSDGNLWMTERLAGKIARIIPEVPPAVTTGGTPAVTTSTATLTGTVRSRGVDTHYRFEYGTTPGYGASSPLEDNGTGDGSEPVSSAIAGLNPGTIYHYRLVATNAYGMTDGADQTFATRALPPKPRISVAPFEMYFSGSRKGSHRLRLSRIVVILLLPGQRVSIACHDCRGRVRHASRISHGASLSFHTHNLSVSSHSRLGIVVRAPDGSRRSRTYRFAIRHPAGLLYREKCFLPHIRRAVSCRS